MQNVGGLLIIAAGAFFMVVGLRGTQHAALPGLFPTPSATSSPSAPTDTIPSIGATNIPIYAN